MKTDHQKDASHLKNNRKSPHDKRHNKDIESGKLKKRKV